ARPQGARPAACRKHGVDTVTIEAAGKQPVVNLAEHAIAQEWNLDQVKSFILEQVRADRPAGIVGGLGYSPGQTQVSEAVLECALLQAARHQFRTFEDGFADLRSEEHTSELQSL